MKFKLDDINVKLRYFQDKIPNVDELLIFGTENNCSDLYVKVGEKPYYSRYGKIIEIPSLNVNDVAWDNFSKRAISSELNAKYVREKMLDFAYSLPVSESRFKYSELRYRVSAGFSQDKNIATFRMISPELPSFSKINFPTDIVKVLIKSMHNKNGIVLFCGPTGSGKSTSMACCINDFTRENSPFYRPLNNSMIVTLEDPIEFVYPSTTSTRIVQKELGRDFKDYSLGIKQALREHPTHIICGEIRDSSNIRAAIEASRTGHKVLTSFHASDVAGTISRLNAYLSMDSKEMIYDLIANIDLIVCQRLKTSNNAFILDTQYMFFTPEIVEYLQNSIYNGDNIFSCVKELMENENLLNFGVLSDWR